MKTEATVSRNDSREADTPLEVSIVMPCLNEKETLGRCVEEALRSLAEHRMSGEVIVADNGSTDGSQQIALEAGARIVQVDARGYGAALRGGMEAARGMFVVMADADGSYNFMESGAIVRKLRAGFDLVIGNRFQGGIEPGAMPWKNRYVGNPCLSAIGRIFFCCPVRDFHCGIRGLRKERLPLLDLQTLGMEFASEMIIKATLHRLRITEVPATLRPDGRRRPPHLRPWRDGWRHLRFMLLYSPRWLFVWPGIILMVVGAILGVGIMLAPISLGGVMLDVHTLVFAAGAVTIGFQSVCFGAFSQIYATERKLLPRDERYESLFNIFNLERGVIVGAFLIAAGLALGFLAFYRWKISGFGPYAPEQGIRIVVPSCLMIVLGSQTVLISFLLSLLGIKAHSAANR